MLILNKNWLQIKQEKIIKVVAEKYNISEDEVESIYKDIFVRTKQKLQSSEIPRILLHNFGTFQPSLGKINKQIYLWIFRYKDGHMTREVLKEKLEYLFPVRNRIKKELRSKKHKKDKNRYINHKPK